jgi:hypothetical protein
VSAVPRASTTLYLRMPAPLVREAKAEAARRGVTLTALMTDILERRLRGRRTLVYPLDGELGLAMKWYAGNRRRLVRRYNGQFVAILGRRVLDHDRNFGALAERVFERVGVRSVFMPRVQPREERVHVRSPRLALA